MPKVSVLMPVYKTNETYLREAIESILSQTFTDFEFLILDDCPEDTRQSIISEYQDPRIKYIPNEHNLGISRARNKLIDLTQGEYLAIFDHDDISLPTRLEKQVQYLDEHPDIGVVSCWADCFPNKMQLHFPAEDIEIKKLLMGICAIIHSGTMIRKSVLTKSGIKYETEYTPSEDYCLWLRLIEHTQFYNIQESLLQYRVYDNNTSNLQKKYMNTATQKLHLWARLKYPYLYQAYLADRTKIITIRLFNLFTLFKLTIKPKLIHINLLGFIPLLVLKRKTLLWPK